MLTLIEPGRHFLGERVAPLMRQPIGCTFPRPEDAKPQDHSAHGSPKPDRQYGAAYRGLDRRRQPPRNPEADQHKPKKGERGNPTLDVRRFAGQALFGCDNTAPGEGEAVGWLPVRDHDPDIVTAHPPVASVEPF